MFGRVRVTLYVALAAACMGGCGVVDTIHPRHETINFTTERARNESILLNIIRASQDIPLNFVAFSSIAGTSQLGASVGLPGATFAPHVTPTIDIGASTLSGSGTASTQFSISTFETKDFYNALLRPVDLPTLSYFIRQGYPRELLFWLFTDSVEEVVMGRSYEYKYFPGHPEKSCHTVLGRRKCATDMIATAVALGLSVETRTINKPTADPTRTMPVIYARFCFDVLLRNRDELANTEEGRIEMARLKKLLWSPNHLPACRSAWQPGTTNSNDAITDTLEFVQTGTPVGTIRYRITPRSTFAIYEFLGALMATGESDGLILTEPTDRTLLTISSGSSEGGCFQEAWYRGQTYCIPNQAKNTKRIVQLLAQLVALQTTTQDLAVTPLVRVQQ
jgi:hypothetical protein